MLHSIVEYFAENESHKCGYCKKIDSNFTHGMWAHSLTVADYQDLIDRGWRRSGKYCYKPTMEITCCPMYTIRCKSLEFRASKSQKKVLKRFNKYLMGQEVTQAFIDENGRKMSTCSGNSAVEEASGDAQEVFVETKKDHKNIDVNITHTEEDFNFASGEITVIEKDKKEMETSYAGKINTNQKDFKQGCGLDPSKSPCKKAKEVRREKKLKKLKEKGVEVNVMPINSKNQEKQVEDFINELPDSVKHKLQIVLVRTNPVSPEWEATSKATHELYVKYQTFIHNDHPDKCSESRFKEFLVSSPLLEEHSETGPSCGYGSFHQQYWLNGKMIAVGVIDILPKCVSSVYFFYDPHYINLSPGTYGALREIAFTRQLQSQTPELKYYYMGYYIHSCTKMRYKGNFCPSELACPETYKWCPLEDCVPKLNQTPYSRLDADIDSTDNDFPTDNSVNYIPVLIKGMVMPYKAYLRKFAKKNKDVDDLKEYTRLVGAKMAKTLILVR